MIFQPFFVNFDRKTVNLLKVVYQKLISEKMLLRQSLNRNEMEVMLISYL